MTTPIHDIKFRLFKTRKQFRDWLRKNHDSSKEIWLGFYKKGAHKTGITNNDAVEEALCFGWINGKVRRLDDDIYLQRFSPRNDKSIWAESNKKRVAKLINNGLMTEYGFERIRIAKKNGSWNSVDISIDINSLPTDLSEAFTKTPVAEKNFRHFTQRQQRDYLWWIEDAKQAETRKRRIDELVERCKRKIKPGMPLTKEQ